MKQSTIIITGIALFLFIAMASAFAQSLRHLLLGMAKLVHQLAVSGGLFNRVQVGALDILDDRDFKNLDIGEVPHDDRQFMQLR